MPWRGSFGCILTMQLEPPKREQAAKIERQIEECINPGLALEYKDRDHP